MGGVKGGGVEDLLQGERLAVVDEGGEALGSSALKVSHQMAPRVVLV